MPPGRGRVSPRRVAAGTATAALAMIGIAAPAWADTPLAAAPVATPLTAAASAPASVGTQFHGLWQLYTDAQRVQVLNQLQASGVHSVRMDVAWSMLQPDGPESYDAWGVALIDRVINMEVQRGIRPLMTLWLTPAWANHGQSPRALPDDPATYARVARWAAARWDTKVVGWEVWNEENSPAFLEGADPVAYVRLLRAAYPAFKAGSPSTPVVFGGLEYNDVGWIRRAYDAGVKGSFDVMATHPYMGLADAGPATADDGTMWTLTHVQAVHDLMAARGDGGKAIWFTEFGWSTHATDPSMPNWNRGVSEARQAAYLVETITLVRTRFPYVSRMYWYNDRDLADGGVQQQHYGLFRLDLTAKPALGALGTANRAGSAAAAARPGDAGSGTARQLRDGRAGLPRRAPAPVTRSPRSQPTAPRHGTVIRIFAI